jgi:quercetin dioxygenase-like cupin family protein
MSTIITKKYANQVALVTDGSRGIGAPTANPGDTDSRAPSITYQPKSTRYFFDVGIVSLCLSGDDTGGKYCLIEASLAPRMGVPRHMHTREDETYYVLAGELEVIVRDKVFTLREGDTLIAPRDLPHPLRNSGNTENHYLLMFSPSGFEGFLKVTAAPAPDNAVAPIKPPAVAVRNVHKLSDDYGILFG